MLEQLWLGWTLKRCVDNWEVLEKEAPLGNKSIPGRYWSQVQFTNEWCSLSRWDAVNIVTNRLQDPRNHVRKAIYDKCKNGQKNERVENDEGVSQYKLACLQEPLDAKVKEMWSLYDQVHGKKNPMQVIKFKGSSDIQKLVENVFLLLRDSRDWIESSAKSSDRAKSSIYEINSGRTEILLDGTTPHHGLALVADYYKKSSRTRSGQRKHPNMSPTVDGLDAEKELIQYCKEVISAQLNTVHGQESYELNNFALILSGEDCAEQAVHLDTRAPNYTGFMALCDHTPPTNVYFTLAGRKVAQWDDLVYVVESEGVGDNLRGWHQMKHLYEDSKKEMDILLQGYGNCLLPSKEYDKGENLQLGDICLMKGDHLHAGPKCEQFRAVMFFSANPVGGEVYDKSQQYNAATLWGTICAKLYDGASSHLRKLLVGKFLEVYPKCADTAAHLRDYTALCKNLCIIYLGLFQFNLVAHVVMLNVTPIPLYRQVVQRLQPQRHRHHHQYR